MLPPLHRYTLRRAPQGDTIHAGSIGPAALQDVLAGKQTEIEETVGYVFKEGQRLKIPVPYTEVAYRTVKAIEENYSGRIS